MKMYSGLFPLLLALYPLNGQEHWEPVFPEIYPERNDLPMLSIGVRTDNLIQYMIGSRDGYVIAGLPYTNITDNYFPPEAADSMYWSVIKLPITFDITAISAFENGITFGGKGWVIGGPLGQIAYQHDSGSRSLYTGWWSDEWASISVLNEGSEQSWAQDEWSEIRLPTEQTVTHLKASDNTLLAVAGGELYRRVSRTLSWSIIEQPFPVIDLEQFNGFFYALVKSEGPKTSLLLRKSPDGITWTSVLELPEGYHSGLLVDLFTLSESFHLSGRPELEMERLYLIFQYQAGDENVFNGRVSSRDGEHWMDHGSHTYWKAGHKASRGLSPANPFSLNGANIGFGPPSSTWIGDYAGNLALRRINLSRRVGYLNTSIDEPTTKLERYTYNGWSTVFQTSNIPFINPNSVYAGDFLAYRYAIPNQGEDPNESFAMYDYSVDKLTVIDVKGKIDKIDLPNDFGDLIEWVDWAVVSNKLYGAFQAIIFTEYGSRAEYKILATQDFVSWEEVPLPDNDLPTKLFPAGDKLVALVRHGYCVWDGTWSRIQYGTGSYKELDLTYRASDSNFHLLRILHTDSWIDQFSADGDALQSWQLIPPDGESEVYSRITCPDDNLLVAFGNLPYLAINHGNGNFETIDLRSHFPGNDVEISGVDFANGWYYILGPETLRTRDFTSFEVFNAPDDEAFSRIVVFEDTIYGFVSGAVYKISSDRGYLDSTYTGSGWRNSNWLGSFQIIDEELGDIDHLLLGKCWVKPVTELEYWIRTSTLGWIYMRKDWSPWFWRMDDGHWYWLDQDGWPPRAWDDVDQEWEELTR